MALRNNRHDPSKKLILTRRGLILCAFGAASAAIPIPAIASASSPSSDTMTPEECWQQAEARAEAQGCPIDVGEVTETDLDIINSGDIPVTGFARAAMSLSAYKKVWIDNTYEKITANAIATGNSSGFSKLNKAWITTQFSTVVGTTYRSTIIDSSQTLAISYSITLKTPLGSTGKRSCYVEFYAGGGSYMKV